MKPTPAIEKSVSALRSSGLFRRYAHWLHLQWPAGTVEPLPEVREDGSTSVPGLYITGDLTGVPLLKFALDSGARVVRAIAADAAFRAQQVRRTDGVLDLVIVGAGVSGMAAAVEARKAGLAFVVLDAARPYQTIADFPAGKPIFTYPPEMVPAGDLQVRAETKETLYEELLQQSRGIEVRNGARVESVRQRDGRFEVHIEGSEPIAALRVIVAIGRTGNYRRLGVPGEQLEKVHNRLHDPKDFAGRRVLVVGGGDSALEAAAALDRAGAGVTLCHRRDGFPRARLQNVLALGNTRVMLRTEVREIRAESVVVQQQDAAPEPVANDFVFVLIGRDAPRDFFRRSGVRIRGEWSAWRIASLAAFLLFAFALYNWKSGGWLDELTRRAGAFPYSLAGAAQPLDPKSIGGILMKSAQGPAFWYTLAYSALILIFGIRRIRRRRSPYVTLQTAVLMAIQVFPLFLLPELLLPWLDARGWLPAAVADPLFPRANYGHGREFWRAYGFVLAWPLNVYNVFTPSPLWAWLAICFVQTFVVIPAMIYYWGKGAYCGWICSCGALAETLGDNQRHKMPHGPRWNRLNMAGQVILAIAFVMMALRIAGWMLPQAESLRRFNDLALSGSALSYKWLVDVFLAGVIGYGVYFWFSGRVWCRFFCPLAALMNIYTRFSRFRILADKKKCISCNVCTAVCHQGIDVMNFANKGEPMADPQCVRCGACVWSCPTDVLAFGQMDRAGNLISIDRLRARAG